MSNLAESNSRAGALRDLTPAGQSTALWLRQFVRGIRTARLYRRENELSLQVREAVADGLRQLVSEHGQIDLRVGSTEICLGVEQVIRPTGDGTNDPVHSLPFLLYRDGIRRLVFLPGITRQEVDALIDAFVTVSAGANSQDDLVSLLWQDHLSHIVIESVPLEQVIYLSAPRPSGSGGGPSLERGPLEPGGAEMHAALRQGRAAQGLHRDVFEDWARPSSSPDAVELWQARSAAFQAALADYLDRCRGELAASWTASVPGTVRHMMALDPSEGTRAAVARSLVSWVASAMQRCAWSETQAALTQLREIDPDGTRFAVDLASAVAGVDIPAVTESLDAGEDDDHSRFAAIVVGIGRPTLDLALEVMGRSEKVRVRAAACTALTYLCGDEPSLLRRPIAASRWEIVRNTVFILGQIGGEDVVPLLRIAAANPEPRVRRMVVRAVGNVPREFRVPILVAQLDSRDPQLLAAALNMLTREKSPRVAKAILERIDSPDFSSRSEDNQRALFNSLGDVADDTMVGPLEQLLHKGGWFARRSLERVAAARTLRRLGTERALAALEAGLRSRVESVRSACLDAMSSRMAS
jgi:hypothetical protein